MSKIFKLDNENNSFVDLDKDIYMDVNDKFYNYDHKEENNNYEHEEVNNFYSTNSININKNEYFNYLNNNKVNYENDEYSTDENCKSNFSLNNFDYMEVINNLNPNQKINKSFNNKSFKGNNPSLGLLSSTNSNSNSNSNKSNNIINRTFNELDHKRINKPIFATYKAPKISLTTIIESNETQNNDINNQSHSSYSHKLDKSNSIAENNEISNYTNCRNLQTMVNEKYKDITDYKNSNMSKKEYIKYKNKLAARKSRGLKEEEYYRTLAENKVLKQEIKNRDNYIISLENEIKDLRVNLQNNRTFSIYNNSNSSTNTELTCNRCLLSFISVALVSVLVLCVVITVKSFSENEINNNFNQSFTNNTDYKNSFPEGIKSNSTISANVPSINENNMSHFLNYNYIFSIALYIILF